MKFGVFVPQGWRMDLVELEDPVEQWEAMTAVARAADAGPWDSIWLFDHLHTVPEPVRETVFEAWSATAALARDTQRVKIGQMVGCNGYRNPALYAKIAATVDVASHGRLYAGLGAGWSEHEWRAYGYPWTSLKDRMGSFAESVELIHRLWTEDDVVFQGKYHSVDKPIVQPRRRPPLWIGGGGERVTLRLVAQYGDACNFGTGQVEIIKHKLSVLRAHCETVVRDYDEIVKSTSLNLFPIDPGADPVTASAKARGRYTVDEFRAIGAGGGIGVADIVTTQEIRIRLEQLQEVGIQYVVVYIPGVAYDHEPLHRFAMDVVPAFG
ncbi:LLM class F420-dependent oxidoreductase [Kribbella albertanoniae]|uniref:TIGR03560 family F420-dependent LLM class oxidoreductase n=1 Tax=Kribbella albertanoniae TaxID=1266829 RepID=A0A4R4PJU1_9ACTN|nr:TIGR03560 family F420-dependent LLM class oxidoreductase [Kribbella albertanoniae]TDC22236.1 TIGR03560 family F420-dependent LLM class oxidoreductase [Kribbella albertanoniae]